ncbi:MAG: bifunctional DNA primase/polymerase [Candidatus Paceibacterota bacterium]|jgi:hypothetical protein
MQKSDVNLLEIALQYLSFGLSIIPVNGKQPCVKWTEYQTRKPTIAEITEWFSHPDVTGIGIITGLISGIGVLDIDNGSDTSSLQLPPTVAVKTGGDGQHHYYRYPFNTVIRNTTGLLPHIDFRGDGGYVVAPPSMHQSGNKYEWLLDFKREDLADIPDWLLTRLVGEKSHPNITDILSGVSQGTRNESATVIVGKLIHHLPSYEWETLAWPYLRWWNDRNQPPLGMKELRVTYESIIGRENKKEQKQEQTLKILQWKDFDQVKFPEAKWLIKDLIPTGTVTIIAAPSGEKKTWVGMEMSRCIALGIPFINHFETKKGNVLYIEQETSQRLIQDRGRKLGFNLVNDGIFLLSQDSLNLNEDRSIQLLHEFIERNHIEFVVIDTLRSVAGGIKEEKAEEIRMFFNRLKPWKDKGISYLVLDHCRKPARFESTQVPKKEQLLGSQDKTASVEVLHMIRSEEKSNEIMFYPKKSKVAREISPFKILMLDEITEHGEVVRLTYGGEIEEKKLKAEEAEGMIKAYLLESNEHRTSKEIQEALDGEAGKTAIEDALKKMREDKENIVHHEKVGQAYKYWIPKDKPDELDIFDEVPKSDLGSPQTLLLEASTEPQIAA